MNKEKRDLVCSLENGNLCTCPCHEEKFKSMYKPELDEEGGLTYGIDENGNEIV